MVLNRLGTPLLPVRNRCPALPALLTCVSLQMSASAQQSDQWFGTIRPPLAPPVGEIQDRIFIGDNFQGLVYADQDLLGLGTTPTMFYTVRHDLVSGMAQLDTIGTPIAPGTVTDRWLLPAGDFDALAFTSTDVGYGANQFYFIRHDVSGQHSFGTLDPLNGAVADRFIIGTTTDRFTELAFTTTDLGYGANLFYYLRSSSDVPETGVFWGVGVLGVLASWQWRRQVARRSFVVSVA